MLEAITPLMSFCPTARKNQLTDYRLWIYKTRIQTHVCHSRIYDNIGTAMALSGCIETLSIQNGEEGHVYDLIAPESADVIEAEEISKFYHLH